MQSIDRQAFCQLLTGVSLLYGKTLHESVLDVWWQALKQLELSEINAALSAYVTHPDKGQFMPKPADVMEQLQGDPATI